MKKIVTVFILCFCFICNTIIGFSQSYQIDTDDNYQKMDPRPSKEQIAADSNNSVPMYFETDYVCLSESVKGRGIIW